MLYLHEHLKVISKHIMESLDKGKISDIKFNTVVCIVLTLLQDRNEPVN
jgi:hypothetical protein